MAERLARISVRAYRLILSPLIGSDCRHLPTCSQYADDAFARNLPEGQDFVFLPKPFSLKQLIETVKGLMN